LLLALEITQEDDKAFFALSASFIFRVLGIGTAQNAKC
jgi:hypothetical protein